MEERKEEGEAEIQEHGSEHWFSRWERQCPAEAEQDEQLSPELQEAAAAAAQPHHQQQKLWHLFQNSALPCPSSTKTESVSGRDFLSGSLSKTQPPPSPTSTKKVWIPISEVLMLELRLAIRDAISMCWLGLENAELFVEKI